MKKCPVCEGEAHTPLFTGANRHGRHLAEPSATFTISACANCGLLGPQGVRADRDYYRLFYPQGYHDDTSDHGVAAWLWTRVTRLLLRRRIRLIRSLSQTESRPVRLLDVGCGPGHFLSQLAPSVFEAHGLEPVAEAVLAARRRALDVTQGDVLTAPLVRGAYDVVTLWHVLEHIDRPDAALARIHDALDADGLVVIATPDTRSLACRRGREYWFHLDAPRHLHLFNAGNLEQLLRRTGFEVVRRTRLPFDFPLDLFWSLRRDWRCWPVLAVYPLAKCFDRENLLVFARKTRP